MFRQRAHLIIGKEIGMGWNVQGKCVWILRNVSLWYLRTVCCCCFCSTFMLMIRESVDIWMIFLKLCWSYILQSHRWCLLKVCLQWCEMPIDAGHFLLIVASALKKKRSLEEKSRWVLSQSLASWCTVEPFLPPSLYFTYGEGPFLHNCLMRRALQTLLQGGWGSIHWWCDCMHYDACHCHWALTNWEIFSTKYGCKLMYFLEICNLMR